MEAQISILIVDDHVAIAQAMAVALRAAGFEPVVVAEPDGLDTESVLSMASAPDVVMLDVYLGSDGLGIPLVAPLVELGAEVVLFTSSSDPWLLAEGLRRGASAIVDKATPFDRVVSVLRTLGDGHEFMSMDERRSLLASLDEQLGATGANPAVFATLTQREREVLRALIDGEAPKQIARRGGVSVSTVRGHIDRILKKLSVNSQREALALARAADWPRSAVDLGGVSRRR